jgi:hypothetical protein
MCQSFFATTVVEPLTSLMLETLQRLLPYRNTAHAHIPETPKQGQTLQTEGTGPQVPNEITFRETVVVLEKKECVGAVLATASAKTRMSKIINMSRLSPNRLHPGMSVDLVLGTTRY